MRPTRYITWKCRCMLLIVGMLMHLSSMAHSQTWTWTTETVDQDGGTFNSMAIDNEGNVHMGYLSPDGGGTKYGFRSATMGRWYTMLVDKNNGSVNIALDSQERPHLCYLPYQTLKYARWDGSKWQIQEIGPRSGERDYSCGIAIGPNGAPHVTWYQVTDFANQLYAHVRHAVLENGAWRVRTLDFGFSTGKWSCVRVDAQGVVHVSYSAFKDGAFRYATEDRGGDWAITTIEDGRTGRSRGTTPGMGNSMVMDKNGKVSFSYRDETSLRYAWPEGDHWRIEIVDPNANPAESMDWLTQRTSLALDANGNPHIAYETDGSLKHAWWDGKRWKIQPMGIAGPQHRYPSLAISQDNVIYIGYSNPEDGSMRVLIGQPAKSQPNVTHTSEGAAK
jgi:hypothetical protein